MSISEILGENVLTYLETSNCGFCLSEKTLNESFISNSSQEKILTYLCAVCSTSYNPSSEIKGQDNLGKQAEWAEDPNFYALPVDDSELAKEIETRKEIFTWVSENLDIDFSNYDALEVGSGNGLTGVAGSQVFRSFCISDLVVSRLRETKSRFPSTKLNFRHPHELDDVIFNFFFAWHVFEHLVAPGKLIREVASRLPERGIIYFQIPKLQVRHVYDEHLFFMNETAIKLVLESELGFNCYFFSDNQLGALTCLAVKNSTFTARKVSKIKGALLKINFSQLTKRRS